MRGGIKRAGVCAGVRAAQMTDVPRAAAMRGRLPRSRSVIGATLDAGPGTPSGVEVGLVAPGLGSRLEVVVGAGSQGRWSTHREAEPGEDGLGGFGWMEGGEDPHAPAAVRAAQDVDREHAAQ